MAPKHRNRRLLIIALCASALSLGVWLLGSALQENTQFFYDPSVVAAPGFVPESDAIRIGGLVVPGSVEAQETAKGPRTGFSLSDFESEDPATVRVFYSGALPDLFREGQGIVITGALTGHASVEASEVLAKHDENYKPAS